MIRFLIHRPIAVIMSFILIILLGILSSTKIPISLLPDANIPKLDIIIDNPGDTPEDFDRRIVQKIRNNLLPVGNIIDINSYSDITKGKIELFFNYGTDLDLIFFEVNEKIDETLSSLPSTLKRPKVIKSNLADIPSIYLSVSLKKTGSQSFTQLSSFIEEKFKNRLEQCREISFVDISGLAENTIQVSINENLINSLGITLIDIKNALQNTNFTFGNIEISQGHFMYNLSLENGINSISDIEKITLAIGNKIVKLSEIAKINNVIESNSEYFYNQNKAISLAIIKNPNYRETDLTSKLNDIIKDTKEQYPNISISKTKDQTIILKATLNSLGTSLFLGILFAILITLFFLKSIKNVVLIFITVLTSLLIDLFLFYILNISINLISISGLILGVGLMIDNIIIVLDTIEQKINILKDIKEGSIQGINDIITPLISSALTTCSIFIPLIFLSGIAGVLFYDQAISVTIALVSSFFVSILLLPIIYVLLNKSFTQRIFNTKLIPFYEKLYHKIEVNKLITYLSLTSIVILGVVSFIIIDKKQLPKLNSSELAFKIEWNKNYLNKELIDNSKEVITLLQNNIISSEIYINGQNFLSKTQRNTIENYETNFILKLKNESVKEKIKKELHSYLEKKYKNSSLRFLPEENALNAILLNDEYNLKVISYDKEVTSEIIQNQLKTIHPDLISRSVGASERIQLSIDDDKLLIYNINKNAIVEFIKLKLGQEKIINLNYGKNNTPVTFFNNRENLNSLLNSKYTTEKGNQYALKDIINIKYEEHKKGVEADIGGISDILYIKTENPELIIATVHKTFPESPINFEGSYKFTEQLYNEMLYIIAITLILLYLILAIQFESLKLPIIILVEIPIDISVSLFVLYLANQTLNVMSFVGIIIMCGIIINDSILKIDLIRKLYHSGTSIDDAIHTAGKRRLNAIIMTTLTTLFAVTPVLFQNDISTQLQSSLIISLIAGLSIGTLVSIFIIPVLYKKLI
ncbi:efflux RND transporter permease subunit [Aquimarina aggregata]|uniref:efflux RND transporter permease subunit n=1 Tax=Aquimarina aggregata TaxID=1642818 RepID=UPI002491E094|nr:efflux RND transporter permease subunit [Aquimarina aggregata]